METADGGHKVCLPQEAQEAQMILPNTFVPFVLLVATSSSGKRDSRLRDTFQLRLLHPR